MAASIRIEINRKAVRDILQSAPVQAESRQRAKRIEEAAGDDFETVTFAGKDRTQTLVRTKNYEGRRQEATNRTLTRALDAGRD
jgi:hypothetical protein